MEARSASLEDQTQQKLSETRSLVWLSLSWLLTATGHQWFSGPQQEYEITH